MRHACFRKPRWHSCCSWEHTVVSTTLTSPGFACPPLIFRAVPQAAAASVGKSPSPECLKPELSKPLQHLPAASPSLLPGLCKGTLSLLLRLFQDTAIPLAAWGLSLHQGLTMQHFFRSKEAFPRFLCCSNADNCKAIQKPQVLKAARFCFLDVN